MSVLKDKIAELQTSVENLEASVQLLEESKKTVGPDEIQPGQQQDMFNGAGKAVMQRVDKAIADVEHLLGESQ